MLAEQNHEPLPTSLPEFALATTSSGIQIYALRTGWVGVKKTHRDLDVPAWLALPTILFQSSWAKWMPIISYVVVHPEGIFLVDTGPSERQNKSDYYECDKFNEFFYKRNLRFSVPKGDTLAPRLQQIGISASQISKVLITHFHAVHVGALDVVQGATIYTGPGNWPSHVGAFTCRLPKDFKPVEIEYAKETRGEFEKSFPLTRDGKVAIVPLEGHTPSTRAF